MVFPTSMELPSEPLLPWLVLGFLVVVFVLRLARSKGRSGELRVRSTIRRRLNGKTYSSLHDLTLPTLDGTTQIDHVIVSQFGVFVIETKNSSASNDSIPVHEPFLEKHF